MEEPWNDRIEDQLIKWKEKCVELSNIHELAGYKIKSNHNFFGLPPIIIPLVMTYVSQLMDNETKINGMMFLVSGISGAVYKWLNLGEKYTLHFQYASKYQDLIYRINSELSRGRTFRRPADVFLTEMMSSMNHLNQTSPDIPTCMFSLSSCKDRSDHRDMTENRGPELSYTCTSPNLPIDSINEEP